MKKHINKAMYWLAHTAFFLCLVLFAFNQGTKAYNWLVNRDNTLSFYNEKINVTCLQTMDPSLPAIFCLPGDRTKD